MPKYSKQFKKLYPYINSIVSYIEIKVGGTVYLFEDKDLKAVNLRWKRVDPNTKEVLRYNYVVPYLELESTVEPIVIARSITDKIEKGIEDG